MKQEPMTAAGFAAAKKALEDGVLIDSAWSHSLCDSVHIEAALEWIARAVAVMRHMNDSLDGEWGSRQKEADALCANFPPEMSSRYAPGLVWPWERES